MMNEDIVLLHVSHGVAIIDRQILEPAIGGLDDDVGVMAGASEHALDAENFMADRIAIPEGGQHLVDAHQTLDPARTGPAGKAATRSAAGGRMRLRRPNQPGSGSIRRTGSFASRSNMSMYFRSMTGHA